MPAHPEPAGVVNDDKIRAALFDELGADASAGAGRNDRLDPVDKWRADVQ